MYTCILYVRLADFGHRIFCHRCLFMCALAPPSVKRAKVMPKEKRYHWKSCGQYCAAVGCSRNRRDNPSLSFFRFPKDEERQDILLINRVKRE